MEYTILILLLPLLSFLFLGLAGMKLKPAAAGLVGTAVLGVVTLPAGTVNRLCGLLASTVTMNGSHWNTSLGMVVSTTRYCP